jgi:hypothetical protein
MVMPAQSKSASKRSRQRVVRSDFEAALGERVQKADLREAALLVGLVHTDQLEDVLRTWGCDTK